MPQTMDTTLDYVDVIVSAVARRIARRFAEIIKRIMIEWERVHDASMPETIQMTEMGSSKRPRSDSDKLAEQVQAGFIVIEIDKIRYDDYDELP
jgi:hypothetical protein